MRKVFLGLALLCAGACSLFGQTTQTLCDLFPNCVTGSAVPDDVAYQLVFLSAAVPNNPTQEQLKRQQNIIAAIGLTDDDAAFLTSSLVGFRDSYINLYTSFVADIVNGADFNIRGNLFLAERAALVSKVQTTLQNGLSPSDPSVGTDGGYAILDSFVQGSKVHMETVLNPR